MSTPTTAGSLAERDLYTENGDNGNEEEEAEEAEMDLVEASTTSDRPRKRPKPSHRATAKAPSSLKGSPPRGSSSFAGICRIEVARVEWNSTAPWQRLPQTKATGTGFCIRYAGRPWVMTNAHVVRAAVDTRVRLHGHTKRYAAHTAVYAPDVDLALLQIDDADAFFGSSSSTSSLFLEFAGDLPALQESVHVVGFPSGGKNICITEGVVSRIDMVRRTQFNAIMAIQIDAAINGGNSGGPAFSAAGKVTGVAFFKNVSKKTDNIGYIIPAASVGTFLRRCQGLGSTAITPVYTLSPSVPYAWHGLENKSLRLAHQVPDQVQGVLITTVSEKTMKGILQSGDVLTHIDGRSIANDGTIVLRGHEHIVHWSLLQGKHVDEIRWALRLNKNCGPRLAADCIDWATKWPHEWEDKTGLVVLVDILAHELTFSYSRPWRRVTKYNGTTVLSLEHLRDLWQASCDQVKEEMECTEPHFARIELQSDNDIVLEVREAMAAEAEILKRHQIPKPAHISPPISQYR